MNARRRALTQHYNKLFADVEWVKTPVEKPYARSSNHNYVVRVPNRDELSVYLRERGISTSVHYIPNHFFKMYRHLEPDVPVTERVWKEILTLPLFPDMTESQVEEVVDGVKEFGRTHRITPATAAT
jgi:perosamine synthetase